MSKRLTESQIVGILKEAEAGTPVPELCRTHGVGQSTFYKWRSKYGGMEASDVRRMKELEDENRRLKQMYADLSLKSRMQEEINKKALRPTAERRNWVRQLRTQFRASINRCCDAACLSRTAFYYRAKLPDDDELIDVLLALIEKHPRWGFPKCRKRLKALGYPWNHKRIYRVYKLLKLNLRRKSKRRLPTRNPLPLQVPGMANYCWSMDFMSDTLQHGHRFRTFNVLDDFNREVLGIDINSGIQASRVTQYLDQIAAWRGYPKQIRVDNGPEFTSSEFTNWAKQHDIYIDFIQPGSPYQNGYIERFNRTYREDVLDLYLFSNLDEVRQQTDRWIQLYNYERPHDGLNDMTPIEYLNAA
ncbi:MAG: IS3 family transposase [Alphaproteobacteria bacterium]